MYRSVTVPVFREGIKFLQIPYGQKKVVLFFPFVRNSEWKFPKNIRVPLHILTSSRSLTSLLSRLSALQFKMAEENFDGMYGCRHASVDAKGIH